MNLIIVCATISAFCLASSALAKPERSVLYVYGDVAPDGTVPSGDQEPFHQMRVSDDGRRGLSQFKQAIEEAGFAVSEIYDRELDFSPSALAGIDVLILGSNQHRFTSAQVDALGQWVRGGGGLIAWSDSAFGGDFRLVGVDNEAGRLSNNDLTEQFGMFFMTDNGAGNYLVNQFEQDHFLNRFQKDNGLGFRGEGVSPIRVSPPSVMLARLQNGGLGGGIRLNAVDGELDPERDAALAAAEIGDGRVVAVFDRNLFWNDGEGTRLSDNDNREFLQRIVLWAAKEEARAESLFQNGTNSE